jgi:hypothetical protein
MELHYREDHYNEGYRVWQSTWTGDQFEVIARHRWQDFMETGRRIGITFVRHDED